ncbi:hypothetical protein V5799_003040, partial [Amblyomma americanum]
MRRQRPQRRLLPVAVWLFASSRQGAATTSDSALSLSTKWPRQRRCNTPDTLRLPDACITELTDKKCTSRPELQGPPSHRGSGLGTCTPVSVGSDIRSSCSSNNTCTKMRPVSPTLAALRQRDAGRSDSRGRRQRECYQSPSYEFWFGDCERDERDCNRGARKSAPPLLKRHLSMAAVRSDEDVSDEEEEEGESEGEAGSDDGSYCSSCESGSAYIDDALHESSLMLDSYTSFEMTKASSEAVGELYYQCQEREDEELFAGSTSRPEKCVASGARLYFGQVGAENHFQVRPLCSAPFCRR